MRPVRPPLAAHPHGVPVRVFTALSFAILLIFLLTAVVSAESGVSSEPDRIRANVMLGPLGDGNPQRTLTLTASRAVTTVAVTPGDLQSPQNRAILASAITVQPAGGQVPRDLAADTPLVLPVTIDMANTRHAGAYTGNLLITYAGDSLKVPVEVNVKHNFIPALILLLTGVGVSFLVNNYLGRGQKRDKLIVRYGRVRSQMANDGQVPAAYQASVEGHIQAAEAHLEREEWDKAEENVAKAEAEWLSWGQNRADWIKQLRYRDALTERVQKLPAGAFRQEVERSVDRSADKLETPQKLRDELDKFDKQLSDFSLAVDDMERLRLLVRTATSNQAELRKSLDDLQMRLPRTSAADAEAWKAFRADLDKALLAAGQAQDDAAFGLEAGSQRKEGVRESAAPPALLGPAELPSLERARRNLSRFGVVIGGVALLLLAGLGFNETYLAKDTFGASPFDYITLAAWGFGAEFTRKSLTDLLSGWGISWK